MKSPFVSTNRLSEARGNISIRKYSAELGITASSYHKIENGEVGLSSKIALSISKLRNISLDYLYGLKDSKDINSNFDENLQNENAELKLTIANMQNTIIELQANLLEIYKK